jgi:hypothetical protein
MIAMISGKKIHEEAFEYQTHTMKTVRRCEKQA